MTWFTDQMGRSLALEQPPRRIISLVPSQTELLAYLGLEEEVVGITRFCIHPRHWRRDKPRVGGTKQLHTDRIDALRPDLIIGNKEENDKAQIEALAGRYPVWMSDVGDLDSALDMIRQVGVLCDVADRASALALDIAAAFASLPPQPLLRAAYLIWRNPWMAAGSHTFIHDMLGRAGFGNVFENQARYPEFSLKMLADARPEVVLLSSEPYPFKDEHIEEIRAVCPQAVILLADGELFSWYGSRLLQAPSYFYELYAACRPR